ncbi:hypothetical protein VR010_14515 [Actinomycetaceae bacterium L2_0104]
MMETMLSQRRLAAGLILVAACLGVSGCVSESEGSVSASLRGINPNAELDYENAVVHAPRDYVDTNFRDYDDLLIDTASNGAFIKCVREKVGVDLKSYPIVRDEPVYHMFWRYGPWTKPVAEKFAFVPPTTDGALMANGLVPRPADYEEPESLNPYEDLSEEDREKMRDACSSDPDVQRFDSMSLQSASPGTIALEDSWDQADNDPEMKALVEELDACFQTKGMEANPRVIGDPKGADRRLINEEQIDMALKTVECKDQIDFTQRVADILAKHQMDVINEHAGVIVKTCGSACHATCC